MFHFKPKQWCQSSCSLESSLASCLKSGIKSDKDQWIHLTSYARNSQKETTIYIWRNGKWVFALLIYQLFGYFLGEMIHSKHMIYCTISLFLAHMCGFPLANLYNFQTICFPFVAFYYKYVVGTHFSFFMNIFISRDYKCNNFMIYIPFYL